MNAKSLKGTAQSKRTIIQCPSCTTKFAVSKDSLSSVMFPRFHCSRCDRVFGASEEAIAEAPQPELMNQQKQTREAVGAPLFSISEPAANTEDDDLTTAPRRPSIQFPSSVETPSVRPPVEQPVDKEAVEAPNEDLLRKVVTDPRPPHEPLIKTPTSQESEASRQVPAAPPEAAKDQINLSFSESFKEPDEEAHTPGEIRSSIDLNANALKARGLLDDQKKKEEGPRVTSTLLDVPNSAGRLRRGGPTGPWGHVMLLTAPLVGCFLLLTIASVYISHRAETAQSFTHSLFPSAPQVAPSGLLLKQASFKKHILESGDSIFVISGTLSNSSDKTFRNIMLEGLVFGAGGEILQSLRVSASSTLAGTRINSLSFDMIDKIQSGAQSAKLTIKPGQSSPFAIAFTEPFKSAPNFFSARIYSVKY